MRGYLIGSGWKDYQASGAVCGLKLPANLKLAGKLPEPLFTPASKAEQGEHDENISFTQAQIDCAATLSGVLYGTGKNGAQIATEARAASLALYSQAADYALTRRIIIADTKFEFGLDENGEVVLGDEMITPDCSRFWPLEGYKVGQGQPSYDKQFVRDWLSANPDAGYELPQDVIDKTIGKYIEAYELLTGQKFDF